MHFRASSPLQHLLSAPLCCLFCRGSGRPAEAQGCLSVLWNSATNSYKTAHQRALLDQNSTANRTDRQSGESSSAFPPDHRPKQLTSLTSLHGVSRGCTFSVGASVTLRSQRESCTGMGELCSLIMSLVKVQKSPYGFQSEGPHNRRGIISTRPSGLLELMCPANCSRPRA